MKNKLKIYVRCGSCNDGNYSYKKTVIGQLLNSSKEETHRIYYDVDPQQLKSLTISAWVDQLNCRKCGESNLKEATV
jgi:hypothetical protein